MFTNPSDIRVLDLFSGAGGLSQGFHQASERYKIVAAVESDDAAAASYAATFGRDIVYPMTIQDWLRQDLAPANVDVIIGGPPCQGFSTLGKQDENDLRNSLWEHYAKAIQITCPRYFIMENVPAFLKSSQYIRFKKQTERNRMLFDYVFDTKILNSADYNVPQIRHRAVIIGHRKDCAPLNFPSPTTHNNPPTLANALRNVPQHVENTELPKERVYHFNGKVFPGPFAPIELHLNRHYTDLSMQRIISIPYGGNRFDIPESLLAPCWKKYKTGAMDVMGRLKWEAPSVTIRTEFFKPEKGRYLHPTENRALTPYEAALIQGFPPSHRFVGSKTSISRQIGNAVPINLAKSIGTEILKGFQS